MHGDGSPLRAYWSKRERDVMFSFPRRCDGHYLHGLFPLEVTQELDRRGYDLTTLKFSIQQKQLEDVACVPF